jgi:hypothetical protein
MHTDGRLPIRIIRMRLSMNSALLRCVPRTRCTVPFVHPALCSSSQQVSTLWHTVLIRARDILHIPARHETYFVRNGTHRNIYGCAYDTVDDKRMRGDAMGVDVSMRGGEQFSHCMRKILNSPFGAKRTFCAAQNCSNAQCARRSAKRRKNSCIARRNGVYRISYIFAKRSLV